MLEGTWLSSRQRGVGGRFVHGKMRPKRAAADAETESHKLRSAVDSMADEWVCPITFELPLDPMMAEDGCTLYERAAFEELIRTQGARLRSPITNEPMGARLVAHLVAARLLSAPVRLCAIRSRSWCGRARLPATRRSGGKE